MICDIWNISSLERTLQQKEEFTLFAVKTISRKIVNSKFSGYKIELSNLCSINMNIAVFVKKSCLNDANLPFYLLVNQLVLSLKPNRDMLNQLGIH